MPRTPLSVLAALTAAAVTTALAAGPAHATIRERAVAPVKIKPSALTRGADIAVPHVEGRTLVDGAVRIPVDAASPDYLGRSGADYVVHARGDQGVGPVLRLTAAGARTTIVTPSRKGDLPQLSTDGSLLAQAVPQRGFTTTRLTVWSTTDGSVVSTKAYPGIVRVLGLDDGRVVVGGDSDTTTWKLSSGLVRKIVSRYGYSADLAADRLATFTKDPYDGGCTVVSKLSKPKKALWRSCDLRVESFAPSGGRSVAVDLLSDGIGPGAAVVVNNGGKVTSTYLVRGYFGPLTWETRTALLLPTYGRSQSATVRCTAGTCERATDLAPTPPI